MLNPRAVLLAFPVALAALFPLAAVSQQPAATSARVDSYSHADGQSYFAISLAAALNEASAVGHDVVVMFDTSASQTGPVREKAMRVLQGMLGRLSADDRVYLLAVDVDAVPMTDALVPADGDALDAAVERLSERVPLGTTDVPAMLEAAADVLGNSDRADRAVVYIGDGMSTGSIIDPGRMSRLTEMLVERRIPVTSYAIGPRIDGRLLAVLANYTGGRLVIDGDDTEADAVAGFLASAAQAPVLWPTSTEWPDALGEVYPQRMPPLRLDRETVVVGTGDVSAAHELRMSVEMNGAPIQLRWELSPSTPDDQNAYLAPLVEAARRDGGRSLPTVGREGLAAARRMLRSDAHELNALAEQALVIGATDQAEQLAMRAKQVNPQSRRAGAISEAAHQADDTGAAQEDTLRLSGEPAANVDEPGALIDEVQESNQVLAGYTETVVRNAVNDARSLMGSDPDEAIRILKSTEDLVRRTGDLEAEFRSQLLRTIEAALREGSRRADEKLRMDLEQRELEAAANERRAILRDLYSREETIEQYIARFNSLLDQEYYKDAEAVAQAAIDLDPNNAVAALALTSARMTGYIRDAYELRILRQIGVVEALRSVEASHIPISDEPPILYPDPQVWQRLTKRRKEFSAVDLSARSDAEKNILSALDARTTAEFFETPLSDVVTVLGDEHDIPIVLDQRALDEFGVGTDTPITLNVEGLSLRSALRLILRDLDLTYLIEDEVLILTTPDEAAERLTTRVYPVADLVVPIINVGGGGGFGGGGGGGGFGGGGGGFGGGGGGFGGGGGGFGGGGGQFNVPGTPRNNALQNLIPQIPQGGFRNFSVNDEPQAAAVSPSDQAAAVRPLPGLGVTLRDDVAPGVFWNDHFAGRQDDPAKIHVVASQIRVTARYLMKSHEFAQLTGLIRAALRHGYAQPWMYEGLALAMQADGHSRDDVERALLSAMDFATTNTQRMYIAQYLAKNGYEHRALELFRQAAGLEPTRPEPLLHGLQLAERLDDLDGIRWATVEVLSRAWPDQQQDVWNRAYAIAAAKLDWLKSEGRGQEADEFKRQLDEAMIRDCIAIVTWTGEADVDLLVEEPSGTLCSYRNPRTTAGGLMLGDAYASSNERGAEGLREAYVCPRGFDGQYRLLLRRTWGEVTAGKATVDLYLNYGTDKAEHIRQQIPLGDKDAVVTFELKNGRRDEPLADVQVASAAADQIRVGRSILNQQLAQLADTFPVAGMNAQQTRPFVAGVQPVVGLGAVGFQPVIIPLPEGTSLTILPSVISADRRYVRTTPIPLFSAVTEVNTFNFATGAGGMTGGGTGGAGFGGGGGGFGGGGGGGFGGGGGGGLGGGGGGGLF